MRKFFTLMLIAVLSSCSSQKGVDNRPSWVQQRPIDSNEFIGIGSASKSTYKTNYLEVAKNNALSDLSSEISVNISATSVLTSVETSNSFRDEYSSVIKSKTIEDLEGYKMISSYDSEDNYWVYYSLSKSEYSRIKKQKKDVVLSKSKDYYLKGLNAYNEDDLKLSFDYLFKSLVALKDYWSESTEVDINGQKVLLGNEIVRQVKQNLNELEIVAKNREIESSFGKSIANEKLSFTLLNKKGVAQKDLPVVFYYSEKRLIDNRVKSDIDGVVSYRLRKSGTVKEHSSFTCSLDVKKLIEDASKDYMLLKLYNTINIPSSELNIIHNYPSFYIDSNERLLGEVSEKHSLLDLFSKELSTVGFDIVSSKDSADFVLKINSDTRKITKNEEGVYSSELNANIDLFSNNINIFSAKVSPYKGRGNSFLDASQNAYKESNQEVKVKLVNQIIDEIF